MTDPIKKETEYTIRTGFCSECNSNRFFYQHKSITNGFANYVQIRGQTKGVVDANKMETSF